MIENQSIFVQLFSIFNVTWPAKPITSCFPRSFSYTIEIVCVYSSSTNPLMVLLSSNPLLPL